MPGAWQVIGKCLVGVWLALLWMPQCARRLCFPGKGSAGDLESCLPCRIWGALGHSAPRRGWGGKAPDPQGGPQGQPGLRMEHGVCPMAQTGTGETGGDSGALVGPIQVTRASGEVAVCTLRAVTWLGP